MSNYQEPDVSPGENEVPDDKGSEAIEKYGSRIDDPDSAASSSESHGRSAASRSREATRVPNFLPADKSTVSESHSESRACTADLDPNEPLQEGDRDGHKELLSPASQIGRLAQTGGTPESRLDPNEKPREGWDIPDQTDTPEEWPEPTQDN